jgi:predicted dehydrogenase
MGRTHARNLASLPGFQLVGVCGTSLGKAADLIAPLGDLGKSAEAFDDFTVMLRRAKPHAVVIAIPPFAHAGQTQAAARRGCHLLLEKPIAFTLKDALSMQRSIAKGGGVAVVGHHNRYGAMMRRLGELVRSGQAGKVTLVQGRWFCNALHSHWWQDLAKSGGQVVEQVIHTYDAACLFLGKPTSVSGFVGNLTKQALPGYTVEDTHASVVGFEGGAMASMCGSNAAIPKTWENKLTVVCEKLVAEVQSADEGTLTWSDGKHAEQWGNDNPRVERVSGKTDLYLEVAKGFVDSIREGKPVFPAATVEDAVRSLSVVLGVVKSSAKGGARIALG